jgi:hypothetical protein
MENELDLDINCICEESSESVPCNLFRKKQRFGNMLILFHQKRLATTISEGAWSICRFEGRFSNGYSIGSFRLGNRK